MLPLRSCIRHLVHRNEILDWIYFLAAIDAGKSSLEALTNYISVWNSLPDFRELPSYICGIPVIMHCPTG